MYKINSEIIYRSEDAVMFDGSHFLIHEFNDSGKVIIELIIDDDRMDALQISSITGFPIQDVKEFLDEAVKIGILLPRTVG